MVPKKTIRPYPFHYSIDSLRTYLTPEWWSQAFGYLAFVPLVPIFDNPFFSCFRDPERNLHVLRNFVTNKESHRLHLETCDQWQAFQDRLILAVRAFKEYQFQWAFLLPTPPSMLGFPKSFSSQRAACFQVHRSRDWFTIWIALLSYLLVDLPGPSVKAWFTIIVGHKVEQAWLSGLQSFILGAFAKISRVGTFLDPFVREIDQPTVAWFCKLNIPVWYRWGSAEARSVQYNADLQHLQPPPEVLQQAITFLVKSPSSRNLVSDVEEVTNAAPQLTAPEPSGSPLLYSQQILQHAHDKHLEMKPWASFFASRKAENGAYLRNETSAQKAHCIAREKQHPTSGAEVFLWDWSLDDCTCLVRSRVAKNERKSVATN